MTTPPITDPRIAALRGIGALPVPVQPAVGQMGMAAPAPTINAPLPLVTRIPTQTEADTDKLHSMVSSGSGIDQIQNPIGRNFARAGNILGEVASAFAPPLRGVLAAIPGTTERHNMLVSRMRQTVANDNANDLATAQTQDAQAQAQQRQSLAEQEQAKAQSLLHPVAKPVAEVKPENLQQEHADAVMDAMKRGIDPAVDPRTQQLADAITSLQRQPATKDQNKDDKYIAINSKLAQGQTLTPDETAFKSGYEHYVKVNKLDPAGVRASIMLQMPETVADPNNPGHTLIVSRRNAIGMQGANDMSVTQPRNVTKDFTDGAAGKNLTAINTAYHHLDNLDRASEALQTGNVKALNSLANEMGIQVQNGASPQAVYGLVRTALTGELGKSFSGTGATVDEQKNLATSFNPANSLATDRAVSASARSLLRGKEQALHEQYTQGMQGKPNFAAEGSSIPKDGDTKSNSHGDKVVFRNGKWGPA